MLVPTLRNQSATTLSNALQMLACRALILWIRTTPLWLMAVALHALPAAAAFATRHYALYLWCLGELAFVNYYMMLRWRVRRAPAPRRHECATAGDRRRLAERAVDDMCNLGASKKAFLAGWFHGATCVTRDAFERWTAWAFFDSEPHELEEDALAELRDLVTWFERRVGHVFPRRGPAAECIRLKYDAVNDVYRPLMYYWCTWHLWALGRLVVRLLGFRQDAADRRVFYRASAGPGKPLVFVHGIGIGFVHYALLLASLPREAPVVLVEWPHCSQCLDGRDPPSQQATVASVRRALASRGHGPAVFLAHSLGTTAVAWCLKAKRSPVRSVILIDPLCFLLVAPTTAFNFLHRAPSNAIQLLLQFFIATELFTANTIQRHFSWTHNTLFVDDLPAARSTVILAAKDLITNAPLIRQYLQPAASRGDVDVHFHRGLEHGELFLRPALVARTARAVRAHCGLP